MAAGSHIPGGNPPGGVQSSSTPTADHIALEQTKVELVKHFSQFGIHLQSTDLRDEDVQGLEEVVQLLNQDAQRRGLGDARGRREGNFGNRVNLGMVGSNIILSGPTFTPFMEKLVENMGNSPTIARLLLLVLLVKFLSDLLTDAHLFNNKLQALGVFKEVAQEKGYKVGVDKHQGQYVLSLLKSDGITQLNEIERQEFMTSVRFELGRRGFDPNVKGMVRQVNEDVQLRVDGNKSVPVPDASAPPLTPGSPASDPGFLSPTVASNETSRPNQKIGEQDKDHEKVQQRVETRGLGKF